jgi:hypothetical protein
VAVWIDRADGGLSNGASFVKFGAVLRDLRAPKDMTSQKSKICDSSSEWVRLFSGGVAVAGWQCLWLGGSVDR